MSVSEHIEPTKIKYEGVFDWRELYSTIVTWFDQHKYDYYEKKHVKKPGTYGNELEFETKSEREESNYVRYEIEIAIKAFHVEEVEIITNGEKKTMNKAGMMTIDIKPKLTLDWKDKWKGRAGLQKFMHKYLMKHNIEKMKDELMYESYKLQTKIKEELNLEHKYLAH